MLTHEEMIGLQAEKHELINAHDFQSREEYVLHLIHSFAYIQAATLVEGKAVLDLGCNTGYGSEILSRAAERVVGVDVSEEAISIAKKQYNNSDMDFYLIDGKQLPFDDNEFDVIISCQVIEHIVDYNVYIDELKRVLAPTGIVIFTTPNALLRLDPGMKPWNKFHVREFDHSELKTLLGTHFSAVQIMGLSAEEPTYLVEKNRLDRARQSQRQVEKKQRSPYYQFRSLVKNIIPTGVLNSLRQLSASSSQKDTQLSSSPQPSEKVDKTFIEEHALKDFFYSVDKLDVALDLLALCSQDSNALEELDVKLSSQNVAA